jgi:hypothetical protein
VRSACASERPTTVTHGQSWSLGGCKHESAPSAFALVRALETSPKLVVRDRIELSTFRFSEERTAEEPRPSWLPAEGTQLPQSPRVSSSSQYSARRPELTR